MASRSVWRGFIEFGLVTLPVKAYTAATTGGGKIQLNQLHAGCNSRINYKKTCPVHGEVASDQIVSGYEFSKGQFVVIDPADVEKLRTPRDKAINIEGFIKQDAIEPSYYSGKTYYLVPDNPIGQKPYGLLHRVMVESGRCGFARVAWSGRRQLVLVRPLNNLIAMTMVSYDHEMKKPAEFQDEVVKVEASPTELKLAKALTDSMAVDEFDLSEYKDDYTDKLMQVIEAKIAGQEVVEAPQDHPPQVINLMEALQRSLDQNKKVPGRGKPAKLMAPSTAEREKPKARRKSS